MLAKAAFPAFFLTLIGFILLLLVTLSVPIIKDIYLLRATSISGDTTITLGVFGFCFGNTHSSDLADYSSSGCSSRKVGYNVPDEIFGTTGDHRFDLAKSLVGALVLNAVATGFAGIALFFAAFAYFFSSRIMEILTFIFVFLATLFVWIVFWIDLAVAVIGRERVNDFTHHDYEGHIGNAFWLAFGAIISLTLAICAAGCGVFGRYSSNYNGAPPAADEPKRGLFKRRGQGTY